jgi:hypothetical protein
LPVRQRCTHKTSKVWNLFLSTFEVVLRSTNHCIHYCPINICQQLLDGMFIHYSVLTKCSEHFCATMENLNIHPGMHFIIIWTNFCIWWNKEVNTPIYWARLVLVLESWLQLIHLIGPRSLNESVCFIFHDVDLIPVSANKVQKPNKSYEESIEILLRKHRNSMQKPNKSYEESIEILLRKHWNSMQKPNKSYEESIEILWRKHGNLTEKALKFYGETIEILLSKHRNSMQKP